MRVLYLTHRLPYAPNRGDRVRAYHTLRFLAPRAEVDLVSLVHDGEEAGQVRSLDDLAVSVTTALVPRKRNLLRGLAALPTRRPLTQVLLDTPTVRSKIREIALRRRPDVVLAYCSGVAQFVEQDALHDIPLVLDLVDVDSQKWQDLADRSAGPMRWIYRREARHLGTFEASVATRAVATLVVNEREAAVARRLAPLANVRVVPNGISVDYFRAPQTVRRSPRVVFCGVMNYQPNEEGGIWLARHVWPLVRARRPDASLALVGSNPTRVLRSVCASDSSICVTGTVPDVRPFLWDASVAVAPLFVARGVQNKVLEAVAAGLTVVATSAVAGGLPAAALRACEIADSPERFADAIVGLLALSDSERRHRTTAAALHDLEWSPTLTALWDILGSARPSVPGQLRSAVLSSPPLCSAT